VKFNPLATLGLRFSRECSAYFWAGWAAWSTAGIGTAAAVFFLRVSEPPAFYGWEALAGLLAPFVALYLADHVSLSGYERVSQDLRERALAPLLLDIQAVEQLRREMGGNLLLRWLRPPLSKSVREQLMTAALWYPALVLHAGHAWQRRYGEWVADVLCGYLPLFAGWIIGALFPGAHGQALAVLITCLGLITLGLSSIRLGARRQAILDYFRAWLTTAEERARGEADGGDGHGPADG